MSVNTKPPQEQTDNIDNEQTEPDTDCNIRQDYAICNGGGRDLGSAQDKLFDSVQVFLRRGFVAQGGISHVIQYFNDGSFIHILCQVMVNEIGQSETD